MSHFSLVSYTSFRRRGHILNVLEQSSAFGLERRRDPGGPSGGELGVREVDGELTRDGVQRDAVPVPQQGDRTPHLGLGGHVPDDESVGAAGEAAVSYQGHIFT